MTTIIAIEYNHGVIMAADEQGTTGDDRSEPQSKILEFGDRVLLGCSGSSSYIADFWEKLRDLLDHWYERDYKEILREAIVRYSAQVVKESKKIGVNFGGLPMPRASIIQGIMACRDRGDKDYFKIFEFITPHVPEDVSARGYALAGTGEAPAEVYFRMAEFLMQSIERIDQGETRLHWYDFGEDTIKYFELLVIQNVTSQDIYTGLGFEQKVLGNERITTYGLSPLHPMDWSFLRELMGHLKKDLTPRDIQQLREKSGLFT